MIRLGYRDGAVLAIFVFAAACIAWIVFGPETPGPRALRENGQLNWRGWFVLACGAPVLLLTIPHTIHVLLRRPAVEVVDGHLKIWMLPYDTIALAEITRIEVGDDTVDIHRHGHKRRRLNARILDQPRAFFFDEVASKLVSRQLVVEK